MRQAVQSLERHLKAAQSRRPGWAVGLWGDAGVGKTFTIQALLQQSAIKSLSLHSTISEKNLAQQFPRPNKLPLWTEHIFERLTTGQPVNAQALLDALLATLSELAPFVVHIEDLHEADGERLEFVQGLARAILRVKGVGLIATSRSESPEPFKPYRLEPLSKSESDGLLESQAQGKLPLEGLEWVYARALGNALFTLEFFRYLTRQGFLWSDGHIWNWRKPPDDFVPISTQALISTMLSDTVDSSTRSVLEARAMLPQEPGFELESVWASIAGTTPEALVEARQALIQKGLLKEHRFAHPLFWEVIRGEIALSQKQVYSRRALQVFQSNPQLAAPFADEAGLQTPERRTWFEQAAQAAEQAGDTLQAGRWLSRAVDLADGTLRGELAQRAAQYVGGANVEEATRLLEIAVAENPSNSKAIIALASAYARLGLLTQMNKVLESLPKDTTAQTSWVKSLMMIRHSQRDYSGVLKLWQLHPELHQSPDPDTAFWVAFAQMELGNSGHSVALASQALNQPDLSPRQKTILCAVQGLALRFLGRLEEARGWMDQAVEWARASEIPTVMASTLHNRQVVLEMMGLIAEQVADLREAIELYRAAGYSLHFASSLTQLGGVLADMGHYDEAESKLLEAHQHLMRFDNTLFLSSCEVRLSDLYLSWRPPHALQLAQKYSRLALDHARHLEQPSLASALILASRVAVEMGQPERGLSLAQECLELEKVNPEVHVDGRVVRAAALEAMGKKTAAIEALELARARAIGAQVYGVELELSRLSGDPVAAQAALDWFRQRGLMARVYETYRKWPELNMAKPKSPPTAEASRPDLRLRVLGVPGLEQKGQNLNYRGKKRLEILCYLLEGRIAGKNEVGLLEMLDIFYPDTPEAQAKLTLRQQIYLIRNDLGSESILSTANGYALGSIHSDAEEFLKSNRPELWSGPYLHRLGDGWNANVRDSLLLALCSKAEELLESNMAEAARLGQIWLEMEPYDSEALRLCVRALQDNPKAALRIYQQAREQMLEVGEELPDGLEGFLSEGALSKKG